MSHLYYINISLSPLELIHQTLELRQSLGTWFSLKSCFEYIILEHFDGLVLSGSLSLERGHVAEGGESCNLMKLRTEVEGELSTVTRMYVFLGVSVS